MKNDQKKRPEIKGSWLKVFCPEARCLSEEEILNLPEEHLKAAEGEKGLWLEVFCPDEACLTEAEKVSLPVKARQEERSKV